MNIVIVEDDDSLMALYINAFNKYIESNKDLSILYFQSTISAIKFCRDNSVDLILMDIGMHHDIDGIEATKIIKNNNKNIKIILMTAYKLDCLPNIKKEGIESGADLVIEKPLKISEYFKIIDGILKLKYNE